MHYLLLFLLLASTAFGQTRPIVPRADGEGSLGRADKDWGHVYAKTGTFDSISLGGGNIEDVLFPLTKDADLGGFNMTNGATVQANAGVFSQISLGGTTNILYDDGTNLLRNGVLIAGRGVGFPLTNTVTADATSVPGQFGITNLSIIQAQTGVYDKVSVGSIELAPGGAVSFGFENISAVGTLNAQQVVAANNIQSSGSLNVFGDSLLLGDLTYKGSNALTKAYLMHDGTNLVYQYAPREIWDVTRFAAAIANGEYVYPGQQLLWPNNIDGQTRNDMFQLSQTISPLVYTNDNYPTPNNDAFWDLVLRQGRDGATGPKGEDGSANIFYRGAWSGTNASFNVSTDSYTWVSYDGQLYNLIDDSGPGDNPGLSPSNWQVIVSRGADAIVTTVSNIVDRGVWNSYTAYTNLDLVIYAGNTFYVDPTNAPPGANNVPPLSSGGIGRDNAYWTARTTRGEVGATGPPGANGTDGEDGEVTYITNLFNSFTDIILDTNEYRFVNSPALENRLPVFQGNTNGTNEYVWADYAPIGTNDLTVVNNQLYLNGELASSGATLTSPWSVLYSDSATNSVSLALGASNTFLKSTGPASAPVWAAATDASAVTGIVNSIITASNLVSSTTVTGIVNTIIVASNLVSASTASNIALEVSGSATNAYVYWDKIQETNTLRFTDGGGSFFDMAFSTNELPSQGLDVISVTPGYDYEYNTANTNVSGTWEINLGEGPVLDYVQTGNITNIIVTTPYTNRVTAARVTLLTTTNSITFPTTGWDWALGTTPTTQNLKHNLFYIERSRFGRISAVYAGIEDL